MWPHPFIKFEKKHITSFVDPFPGSLAHFMSSEGECTSALSPETALKTIVKVNVCNKVHKVLIFQGKVEILVILMKRERRMLDML